MPSSFPYPSAVELKTYGNCAMITKNKRWRRSEL